jgi:D-tyrosyl-tRNA(Tyr) deacylase
VIALVQRVREASVEVDGQAVGAIGPGLLVLLGVARGDREQSAPRLAERVATYRVFAARDRTMEASVEETRGAVLVVSQFTLCADTRKGRRPSFDPAALPEIAEPIYQRFVAALRGRGLTVATGVFGADMLVRSCNDGPVTFILESGNAEPGGAGRAGQG